MLNIHSSRIVGITLFLEFIKSMYLSLIVGTFFYISVVIFLNSRDFLDFFLGNRESRNIKKKISRESESNFSM